MKKTNKFLALLVTVALLATMAVSAFAADTHTIFVKNDAPNHVYDAYQIFSGSLSTDGSVLSNIVWGSSVVGDDYNYAEALITAITTDTKEITIANGTTTLKDVFLALTSDTNKALPLEKKAAVVSEILGTISNDSATLDRFAEVVGEVIYDAEGNFQSHKYLGDAVATSGAQTTNDAGNLGYEIAGLPAGYYLFKDRDGVVQNEGDFYTKYIVRVVKSDTINVKGQGVNVDKSVNDTLGGTYTEYEDADVNQTLYYKWTGVLPNNLLSYDEYYYKFVDTMSKGLKFVRFEQVYIEGADGDPIYTIMDVTDEDTANDSMPAGITVEGIADVTGENDNQVFSLEIENLFDLFPHLLPSHKIVVKYSTIVTRDALIATSMPNKVEIEYSNNPNGEGTGITVPDVAHAFTFEINVDKYDAADPTKKLEGVEFVLYREKIGENQEIVKHYAQVITEEMVEAGESINGKVVDADDIGVVYGYTTDRSQASVLDTDENGAIQITGLDAGYYYLEETKTNDGYNLLDTPVQIEILPTYTVNGDECTVTVNYEVDARDQGSSNTVGVRNSKGSTLPSTGGIGTTIFYIVGALLVLVAVVVLITKKRVSRA